MFNVEFGFEQLQSAFPFGNRSWPAPLRIIDKVNIHQIGGQLFISRSKYKCASLFVYSKVGAANACDGGRADRLLLTRI